MNTEVKTVTSDRFSLKIDSMITIMDKLCSVLGKENEFLSKNKVKNVEKLIDPKMKLVAIYTEQYNAITANKDLFEAVDKRRKEEVKSRAQILQELMEKNERLLNANMDSTRRLINMIVTDARKYESEQSGVYSAAGTLGFEKKKGANLSYNQVL